MVDKQVTRDGIDRAYRAGIQKLFEVLSSGIESDEAGACQRFQAGIVKIAKCRERALEQVAKL